MDFNNIETKIIDIALLECNEGQIPEVPTNPRKISEERLEALKKSVSELPDMLSMRELLVYPLNGKYVVLGGNQRLVVCKELEFDKIPCKIIPANIDAKVLRRIVMIDNEEFGETDWNLVYDNWDASELEDWGVHNKYNYDDGDFNLDEFFDSESDGAGKKEKKEIILVLPSDISDDDFEDAKTMATSIAEKYDGKVK